MKTKKDDLNKIVQDLAVKLYQQAQKDNPQGAQAQSDGNNNQANDGKGDTVDGDFKEVDPDKKN